VKLQDIPITDGTAQQDRELVALQSDYFMVDELSFEDLLAMAAEFAAEIKFYNLKNEWEGDWSGLFRNDEAVAMAEIISIDLSMLESKFNRAAATDIVEMLRLLYRLSAKINDWFLRLNLSQHRSGEILAHRIASIVEEKLVHELHNLGKLAELTGLVFEGQHYADIWELGEASADDRFPGANITEVKNNVEMKRHLSATFFAFSNAIAYLKTNSVALLQQSLDNGRHDPASGLFLVFLKLYQKAQSRLNRFTSRHLDFYYRQMLKLGYRDQVSDSYFLLLQTQPGTAKTVVKQGIEFSASKDADLQEIVYSVDQEVLLSDARIESIATLYLQQDKLISPEYELAAVTRMKSDHPQKQIPWSLFGAEQSEDARIGFCIASAFLLLAEGERKIDLQIELESSRKSDLETLLADLLNSDSQTLFRQRFGRLFTRYLLAYQPCPSDQPKNQIIDLAESLLEENLAEDIKELLEDDWQVLFYKFFKQIFDIKLTTQSGWHAVDDYNLLPFSGAKTGIRIALTLGQDVEPISAYHSELHGEQLETDLPVLQCVINPRTSFYPYSVFRDMVIASLQIDVEVSKVKNIVAYNQHGQLDPAQPFQPFGPVPSIDSYFVFGCYELARKELLDLKIHFDWAGLPREAGGFEEYYHAYPVGNANKVFRARASLLVDGGWFPHEDSAGQGFRLFDTEATTSRIASCREASVDHLDNFKAIDSRVQEPDFKFDLKSMNGFFRVSLTAPEAAFGHSDYAPLLTKVVAANTRWKKQKPMPNQPYTPTLKGLSLSYKARTRINPRLPDGNQNEKIIQLHPFGTETLFPNTLDKPCYLMPQYHHEGNLFIGLSASDIAGQLSLLFHLSQDRTRPTITDSGEFDWYYLTANSWKKIPPRHLLSDSTHGFLETGIVTLEIPPEIGNDNTIMPSGLFWLRVSIRHGADAFSSCYRVQPHALKVSRKGNSEAGTLLQKKWTPLRAMPTISSIKQACQAHNGRKQETDSERKTRIAERLRHKNRASMPWDYEQLILEKFPQIHKVKCFSCLSSRKQAIKPGQVLIVVVPEIEAGSSKSCAHAMISAQQLVQIKQYVESLSSPFIDIEVRNPSYEQIQVRCKVKFIDSSNRGIYLERLNQQISDYLCPWQPTGYRAKFGWSIRQQDIESFIRHLDYIDYATNFSMLHITTDNDGNYRLSDTAKSEQIYEAVIEPRYPWSIALPVENHFIETMPLASSIDAEITGVDELAVGGTFIISGSSGNGEEE